MGIRLLDDEPVSVVSLPRGIRFLDDDPEQPAAVAAARTSQAALPPTPEAAYGRIYGPEMDRGGSAAGERPPNDYSWVDEGAKDTARQVGEGFRKVASLFYGGVAGGQKALFQPAAEVFDDYAKKIGLLGEDKRSWLKWYTDGLQEIVDLTPQTVWGDQAPSRGEQMVGSIPSAAGNIASVGPVASAMVQQMGRLALPALNAYMAASSGDAKEVAKATLGGLLMSEGLATTAPLPRLARVPANAALFATGTASAGGSLEETLSSAFLGGAMGAMGPKGGRPTPKGSGAFGKMADTIENSQWWRKMTIRERGLARQTMAQQIAGMKDLGLTEGQILRQMKQTYGTDNPQWVDAWRARGGGSAAAPAAAAPQAPAGPVPQPAAPVAAPVAKTPVNAVQPAAAPAAPAMPAQMPAAPAPAAPRADLTWADVVADDSAVPIYRVPVSALKLSKDVPNFKEDADTRTGVVRGQELQGSYTEQGTGTLVAWERLDGSLEVITGRHRLDLARRSGKKTLPVQVMREADGFSATDAMVLDSEMNIRDGQGKVRDYANFFKNSKLTLQEASGRGLLARDNGRKGWALGRFAGDSLYTAYRNDVVKESKAAAIAEAAPNNDELQRLGLDYALQNKSADPAEIRDYLNAVQSLVSSKPGADQLDMFGNSDTAMNDARKLAKAARSIQAQLTKERQVLTAAIKMSKATGEAADVLKKYGVVAGDSDGINDRLQQLVGEIDTWNHWATDPEKVVRVRVDAGLVPAPVQAAPVQQTPATVQSQPSNVQSPAIPAAPAETPPPDGIRFVDEAPAGVPGLFYPDGKPNPAHPLYVRMLSPGGMHRIHVGDITKITGGPDIETIASLESKGYVRKGDYLLSPEEAAREVAPAASGDVIPYDPKMKIANMDQLPRGSGARYLEVIEGPGGQIVAKQWRRKPVAGARLVDMKPDAAPAVAGGDPFAFKGHGRRFTGVVPGDVVVSQAGAGGIKRFEVVRKGTGDRIVVRDDDGKESSLFMRLVDGAYGADGANRAVDAGEPAAAGDGGVVRPPAPNAVAAEIRAEMARVSVSDAEPYTPRDRMQELYDRAAAETDPQALAKIMQEFREIRAALYQAGDQDQLPAVFDAMRPLILQALQQGGSGKPAKLANWQRLKLGGMEYVQPVQMPEVLAISRTLGASVGLKKLRTYRGYFKASNLGDMAIVLDPRIFRDPVGAARTLAHELGHMQDYLPEGTLKRGNVLGRVASLQNYLKNKFGDAAVTSKELRSELWELSQWWKPLQGGEPDWFVKYRKSGKELYADAVSVLYNAPDQLKARAPKFFDEFMRFMERKPEVAREYLAVQELLRSGSEEKVRARAARHLNAYAVARAEIERMAAARQEDIPFKRHMLDTRRAILDRTAPIKDAAKRALDAGVPPDMVQNVQYLLDELPFVDAPIYDWLYEVSQSALLPVEQVGLDRNQLGLLMKWQRVANELYLDKDGMPAGRAMIANPGGETPETAVENMRMLAADIGPDRMQALEGGAKAARDAFFKLVSDGVDAGIISRDLFQRVIEPNRDFYAPFMPVKYLMEDKSLSATIRDQVGTLDETMNEFDALQIKGILMRRWIQHNRTKQAVREMLMLTGEAEPAEVHGPVRHQRPVKPPRGKENLMIFDDGKPSWIVVDETIVDALEKTHPAVANLGIGFLKTGYKNLFYPLWIKYSPWFALRNPFRDTSRTIAQFPKEMGIAPGSARLTLAKALKDTYPDMRDYMRGELSPLAREMLASSAIPPPTENLVMSMAGGEGLDKTMAAFGLRPHMKDDMVTRLVHSKLANPVEINGKRYGLGNVMDVFPWMISAGEVWSKMAGFSAYRKTGLDSRAAANMTRNRVGTPNYLKRGLYATELGNFRHFFNMILQGLTTDADGTFGFGKHGHARRTGGAALMRWALSYGVYNLLMEMARRGVFGEDVKDWRDGIADSDLAKYLMLLPLGSDQRPGGRPPVSQYIGIANDEFVRLMNRMQIAIMRDDGGWPLDTAWQKFAGAAAALRDEVIPPVNAVFEVAKGWGEFMTGDEPLDNFRNQRILSPGGSARRYSQGMGEMLMWTAGKTGLRLVRYNPDTGGTVDFTSANIPGVNAMLRSTNLGHYEQSRKMDERMTRIRQELVASMPAAAQEGYREYYELRWQKDRREADMSLQDRYDDLSVWYHRDLEPTLADALNEIETASEDNPKIVPVARRYMQTVPPPP